MTTTDEGKLQIGWASRDITPDRPVNLQGQFHMRIAKAAKDPLTVTALAISGAGGAGADHCVFLSADIACFFGQVEKRIRQMVRQQIPELDVSKIIIQATHTHTAPCMVDEFYPPVPDGVMTYQEYADFFVRHAAEAIVEAWHNRRCGKIAWGLGHAVVGHNRRAVYFDDLSQRPDYQHRPGHSTTRFARMYGNTNDELFSHIEGYEDHSLNLLYTFSEGGDLTGVIVNLACPSQETESLSLVSADFWHETRVAIRRRLGAQLFILPQCSAAGDQSPHLLWNQPAENRMLTLRGLDRREELGRRISSAVEEVFAVVRHDQREDMPLTHIVKAVQLPRRMLTEAELKLIRADLASLKARPSSSSPDAEVRFREDSARATELKRCELVLARYEKQLKCSTLSLELHAIRLGDITWVTFPFEVFLDYGVRIKARSPALQTFLVQLASIGAGWDGNYLPTARAETGESYSACIYCNSIGSPGGQVLVNEALGLLNELWKKRSKRCKNSGRNRGKNNPRNTRKDTK